jgi:hypothetical protein
VSFLVSGGKFSVPEVSDMVYGKVRIKRKRIYKKRKLKRVA